MSAFVIGENPRDSHPLVLLRRAFFAFAVLMSGCSLVGNGSATKELCNPVDRIVVMESTTLTNAEPSAAFDVPQDRSVFVTLLADPNFNEGAGLNGGLVHASVYVIDDGADPRPGASTDNGIFQPSPDFRLPRYRNVGDSHFVDLPFGTYRLWSGSGPVVEVFSCPST